MRHRKSKLTLNRFTSWRKATLISLSKGLLINQSIRTTKTKAKATQPFVERLISLGKENSLSARRRVFSILQDHQLVKLLFTEIAPRFNNRIGGYTRILPLGFRRGDGASLVILELTQKEAKKPAKKEVIAQPKPPKEKEVPKPQVAPEIKPPVSKKPVRRFLGGLRKIFKKERDSL